MNLPPLTGIVVIDSILYGLFMLGLATAFFGAMESGDDA